MTKEEIRKELEKRLAENVAMMKVMRSNGKEQTHFAQFTKGQIEALKEAIDLFN